MTITTTTNSIHINPDRTEQRCRYMAPLPVVGFNLGRPRGILAQPQPRIQSGASLVAMCCPTMAGATACSRPWARPSAARGASKTILAFVRSD